MESKKGGRVVALDTNILLSIAKFKVDVFAEARKEFGNVSFAVPAQVMKELQGLKGKGKRMENAAEIAEKLIERHGAKIVDVNAGDADSALAELARGGAVIATNDARLRKRIKTFGKVIYLRKKKMLGMEGG